MSEPRRPKKRVLARRLVIGVLVVWASGSLMVASDLIDSRGIAFLVAWAAIFAAGLALLVMLRRALTLR